MDSFSIKGSDGIITIVFQEVYGFPFETSVLGGYDVKGDIDIQCGNAGQYRAKGVLFFSTGQIYILYNQLKATYNSLSGEVMFTNEYDKTFDIEFDDKGHSTIQGSFGELAHERSRLFFEINSNQTYIYTTIKELELIVKRYGDLRGIRKI